MWDFSSIVFLVVRRQVTPVLRKLGFGKADGLVLLLDVFF
jgi:hypothetical protein